MQIAKIGGFNRVPKINISLRNKNVIELMVLFKEGRFAHNAKEMP